MIKPVILIVDDEKNTREGLKRALMHNRYTILLAEDAEDALGAFQKSQVDIMLTDLKMPGIDGVELMHKIKELSPNTITVILTAYGSIETAVSAMKEGAYDFITKPINVDEVDILVKRALSARMMEKENKNLKVQLDKKFGFENIIGNSPEILRIFETIRQVAPTKATVLINGESGTGKELIAAAIHAHSQRANGPFIDLHCAALTETLLLSELFGHEKGSFTGAIAQKPGRFELANGGTLFLDEVSEMDLSTQVKLLRVLETQQFQRVGGTKNIKVDIRLVTATNASLEQKVKEGKFREDLFYRLNVVSIKIPSLRERRSDIPLLIAHFTKVFCEENKKELVSFSPSATQKLIDYAWPGNVRELRNLVESLVILTRNKEMTSEDLPLAVRENKPQGGVGSMMEAEKMLIVDALEKTNGNKTKASEIIGISRRTLHRKIKEYGL